MVQPNHGRGYWMNLIRPPPLHPHSFKIHGYWTIHKRITTIFFNNKKKIFKKTV